MCMPWQLGKWRCGGENRKEEIIVTGTDIWKDRTGENDDNTVDMVLAHKMEESCRRDNEVKETKKGS
jgi:hypothetical protein